MEERRPADKSGWGDPIAEGNLEEEEAPSELEERAAEERALEEAEPGGTSALDARARERADGEEAGQVVPPGRYPEEES